jgi:hypothetical protein
VVAKEVASIPKKMWCPSILLEECIRPHVFVQLWNDGFLQLFANSNSAIALSEYKKSTDLSPFIAVSISFSLPLS